MVSRKIFPVILFLWTVNSTSQGLTGNLKSVLDSISTRDVPEHAPGIATSVILNGKVAFENYAGFADLSDSILIDRGTRFNIASNGKQFTALAVLVLIGEGKIDLSDDLRKFLPTLYPEIESRITVRNLLNHSSGIRDVYDLWALQGLTWWENTFVNEDVLELVEKQEELNFIPNTEFLYSNTNYILLALIIEKVSGISFPEFTDIIFEKLNMPDTSFEQDFTKIRGRIARPYFNFDTWTTYNWIWNVVGDGNIFSTLADQAQWEKILQGTGKTSIDRELIGKSQQLVDTTITKNYGYGLEFGTYKDLDYLFHEGATGAWKATTIRFPEKKLSIVTLTNSGKTIPSMQTRQMADVILDLKDDSEYFLTEPEKIGKFVTEDEILGTYSTPKNLLFEIVKKDDGKLYLKRAGRSDNELVREANNVFHQKYDPGFKQEFTKDHDGNMQVTVYYTSHPPYTLTRNVGNWKNFDFLALNGAYINEETSTLLNIEYKGSNDYAVKIGDRQSTKGNLVTPIKLLADNYVLEFNREPDLVETLLLTTERLRNVKFKRLE